MLPKELFPKNRAFLMDRSNLSNRGELIGDADILIAASALVHGWGVVTNNEHHFSRIRKLRVENWLK
jgi:tRNA(fMet)-specific endonuclease VapC